ncbi:hypothetical protein BGZ65_008477 [Modicella reniformis]|uniref:Uncharacterized protein n=1 Tax=Modicella reniformis TaxID=1440133 RepID=A0A9P6IJ28_9FUNG|nr:hypothetical protein BGZ65_008477 [Modicella reniformis]
MAEDEYHYSSSPRLTGSSQRNVGWLGLGIPSWNRQIDYLGSGNVNDGMLSGHGSNGGGGGGGSATDQEIIAAMKEKKNKYKKKKKKKKNQ